MASASIATRTAKRLTSAKSAWLDGRRGYLGATDISAILGINPYRSAHDVWLDKRGCAETVETIPMRAGTYMEIFIAREFQREFGVAIRASKTYKDAKFPFLACNPDREFLYTAPDGTKHAAILECKMVGHWAAANFGQDGSDQIPEHYMMQVLWQLLVTRRTVAVLAALVDNRELRTFRYSLDPAHSGWAHVFDRELAKRVWSFAINWWRTHIDGGEEPEITGADSDTRWLAGERDSYDNGKMTNTDEATDTECVRLESSLKRLARAESAVAGRKNRIKQFMASRGASSLESTVGVFTWKTNVSGVASFKTPFRSTKA